MDRRFFLMASSGAFLSLPIYASPKAKTSKRLLIFCNHLGFDPPNFYPKNDKSLSSPYLNLFKKYHTKITLLRNMEYKAGHGLHLTPRAMLTGTCNRVDVTYSPSIDQVLSKVLQKDSLFPSLITRASRRWG